MRFATLAAAVLAPALVIADGAAIIKSLQSIDQAALKLNGSLNGLKDIFSAIPLLGDSLALQNAIDSGTSTANSSAPLSTDEAVALVTPTNQLVADTKSVLNNFVAKKPIFDANLISFIAVAQLKDTRDKAAAFSSAVIAKVPASLQDTARQLTADLTPAFNKAIDAYGGNVALPSLGGGSSGGAASTAPGFALPTNGLAFGRK